MMWIDATGIDNCPGSGVGTPTHNTPTWVTYSTADQLEILGTTAFAINGASVQKPVVVWLKDQTGNTGCSSLDLKRVALSVRSPFSSHGYFTSYVDINSWSGADSWLSPSTAGTACTYSGNPANCVHAGRYRDITLPVGFDCDTHFDAAADSFGSDLSWECIDHPTDPSQPSILRGTLEETTGLGDLVDFARDSWESKAVTLTTPDGLEAMSHAGAAWWADSFHTTALGSASTTTLGSAGTTLGKILLVDTSYSNLQIHILSSNVAVVIKSGVQLSHTSASAVISANCTSGAPCNALWIEGPGSDDTVDHMSLTGGAVGVGLNYARFTNVQGLRVSGGEKGFHIANVNGLELDDLAVANSGYGFFFGGAAARSFVYGYNLTTSASIYMGLKIYTQLKDFEFDGINLASNVIGGLYIGRDPLGQPPEGGTFSNEISANNGSHGIVVTSNAPASPLRFWDIGSTNNGGNGIELSAGAPSSTDGAHGVVISIAITSFNGESGIKLAGSAQVQNVNLISITATHNGTAGIQLASAYQTLVQNALPIGNQFYGIQGIDADDTLITQTASIKNGTGDLWVSSSDSTGGRVLGNILYDSSNSSKACANAAPLGVTHDSTNFLCKETQSSTLLHGISVATLASPFASLTKGDESSNSSVMAYDDPTLTALNLLAGLFLSHVATTKDWFNFETNTRLFGKRVSDLASAIATPIKCSDATAGACQLYELALKEISGNPFLKTTFSGAIGDSSQSCSNSHAFTFSRSGLSGTWTTRLSTPWAAMAKEMMNSDDPQNNRDGLCENNETCLYTANFGAYQGHNLIPSPCSLNGSGISGVSIHNYQYNGW